MAEDQQASGLPRAYLNAIVRFFGKRFEASGCLDEMVVEIDLAGIPHEKKEATLLAALEELIQRNIVVEIPSVDPRRPMPTGSRTFALR